MFMAVGIKEINKGKCIDISSEGKGIVKASNMVIMVDNLLLGEEADIQITYKRAGIFYGKIKKLYTKSPERITPICPISSACGGCTFQNASYKYELAYKKKKVEDAFKKIAHINYPINDVIGMEIPEHYRNKIQVPFQMSGKNVIYGFYRQNTHKIIQVDECNIEDKIAAKILKNIAKLMDSMRILAYNEDQRSGVIRHVLIRTSLTNGDVMVVLVTNCLTFPNRNNFVKEIVKNNPQVKTVVQNINLRDTNVILGEKENVLYGKGYIEDEITGVKFHISSKSFFQVNPIQTEKLYKYAIDCANINKQDVVLDAYAGVATIGIIASKFAKHVTSVEIVKEACINAKDNAKRNNINNIRILNKDCTEYLLNTDDKYDVVILDPPRKGSTPEFLHALMKNSPKRIVYISCEPSTLARDIEILSKKYKIDVIQPVDMFPRSFHVETICGLQLKDNKK